MQPIFVSDMSSVDPFFIETSLFKYDYEKVETPQPNSNVNFSVVSVFSVDKTRQGVITNRKNREIKEKLPDVLQSYLARY